MRVFKDGFPKLLYSWFAHDGPPLPQLQNYNKVCEKCITCGYMPVLLFFESSKFKEKYLEVCAEVAPDIVRSVDSVARVPRAHLFVCPLQWLCCFLL